MKKPLVLTARVLAGLYVLGLLLLYWVQPANPFGPEVEFPMYAGHFTNYVPFWSTIEQLHRLAEHSINTDIVLRNTLGHIAAFLPLGLLMRPAVKADWKVHLLGVVTFSLLLEAVQLLFRIGSFDIDSVIFNAAGYLLGFTLMELLQRALETRKTPD